MNKEQNKEKWEIAKYLIDAKKSVDSLWYISRNVEALKNIDLRKLHQERLREFYINCRIVIDKTFPPKKGGRSSAEKKSLKDSDLIIKIILTETDENYAHKDAKYKAKPMEGWKEHLAELKKQLNHVRKICANALPENITLNFVPHDKALYRQVHSITPEREEEIKKARTPRYEEVDEEAVKNSPYPSVRVLHDIEQLKEEKELNEEYGVIFELGLNPHEYLQNSQHSCITKNFYMGGGTWMSPKSVIPKRAVPERNDPCYCGSGKKYKNCCIDIDQGQ